MIKFENKKNPDERKTHMIKFENKKNPDGKIRLLN
jgi:hypothetical protein